MLFKETEALMLNIMLLLHYPNCWILIECGPKWRVQKGESGRSRESGLEINLSIKVDGPKVSNLTVRKCQTGRSKSIKLDRPKVSNWTLSKVTNWTVRKSQTRRFKSVKLDGRKVSNRTVRKYQTLTFQKC